jgi:DNA invertase Pin-like site-specific DNA recombinase
MPRKVAPLRPSFLDIATDAPPLVARVSIRVCLQGKRCEGTDRLFLSPDMQLESARAVCRRQGWTLDEETSRARSDINESASRKTYAQRGGLSGHLEDARRGYAQACAAPFDVLSFPTVDRHARDVLDGPQLEKEFQASGVWFYYAGGDLDMRNDLHRFVRDLLLVVSARRAREIGESVKKNRLSRAPLSLPHGILPGWLEAGPDGQPILNARLAPPKELTT